MKHRAFLYVVLAGIFWGSSGIFHHFLEGLGFSSMQMTFMRGLTAAAIMALYVLLKDPGAFLAKKKHLPSFILSGLAMLGTGGFYYMSMGASSISTAVVLMYTAPAMVMAFSVTFLGEKLTAKKLIALCMMTLGCALVSGVIGGFRFSLWGILAGLLSGISYSTFNVVTKIQMEKKMNPLSTTLYCFVFMAFFGGFFAEPTDLIGKSLQAPLYTSVLFLAQGLFTGFLPYFFYTLGLKSLPAGTASSLSIVEPLTATLFSLWIFKEPLTGFSAGGIALILFAVLLLSQTEHPIDKQKN